MSSRFYADIYIVPTHCVSVDFHRPNHYHIPYLFNQNSINYFGIYNIWQTHTHIFTIIVFIKKLFLAAFFETFLFFLLLSATSLFFWFFYTYWHYCLIWRKILNFINCCSRIPWKYTFLHNDSILFPDTIILF